MADNELTSGSKAVSCELKAYSTLRAESADRNWVRGKCGPSSVNWALGYLSYTHRLREYNAEDPRTLEQLKSELKTLSWGPTWPWRFDEAIKAMTDGEYGAKCCFSTSEVRKSICADLPVISLRSSRLREGRSGFEWHYRNVVGWKSIRWLRLPWIQFTVWDPNRMDSIRTERYNPFYHLMFITISGPENPEESSPG